MKNKNRSEIVGTGSDFQQRTRIVTLLRISPIMTYIEFSKVSVHLLKKCRHFVSPKTFNCVLGLGLVLAETRFRSNEFRASVTNCSSLLS